MINNRVFKIINKSLIYFFFLSINIKLACSSRDIDQFQDLEASKAKVVLSLDGGGIRGLISLTILDEIEQKLNFRIAEACDLIEGTSTGGIQALGLVCPDKDCPTLPRYSVQDLLKIYNVNGEKIFPPHWKYKISSLGGLLGTRYPGKGIREVTQHYFEDTPLSAAITDVGVVANNINPDAPYIFSNHDPVDWFMKDIAVATSAAPTYLPVAEIRPIEKKEGVFTYKGPVYHFVDGGVTGMNNPVVHAYASVENSTLKSKGNLNNIRVISLGTGFLQSQQSYKKVKDAGIFGWLTTLVDMILSIPSQSNNTLMQTFLPSVQDDHGKEIVRYWRINPTISSKLQKMDNVSAGNQQALIEVAKKYLEDRQDIIDEVVEALKARYYHKQIEKEENRAYAA